MLEKALAGATRHGRRPAKNLPASNTYTKSSTRLHASERDSTFPIKPSRRPPIRVVCASIPPEPLGPENDAVACLTTSLAYALWDGSQQVKDMQSSRSLLRSRWSRETVTVANGSTGQITRSGLHQFVLWSTRRIARINSPLMPPFIQPVHKGLLDILSVYPLTGIEYDLTFVA